MSVMLRPLQLSSVADHLSSCLLGTSGRANILACCFAAWSCGETSPWVRFKHDPILLVVPFEGFAPSKGWVLGLFLLRCIWAHSEQPVLFLLTC